MIIPNLKCAIEPTADLSSICIALLQTDSWWIRSLKVHKRETFVDCDVEFCTFLHSICLNIKVL